IDGAWHLFDVTYDGTTATGYMDGQMVGSSTVPTPLATAIPDNGFRVSDRQTGSCYSTENVNEMAVYPTALSPKRIGTHWTAATSASGPCLEPPRDAYGKTVVSDTPQTYLHLGDLAADPPGRVAFDSSGNCTTTAPTNSTLMTSTTAQQHGALQ